MNVSVVIPVLNEELALPKVLQDIPKELTTEIIVVDNGSTDDSISAARAAGVSVIQENRRGYGAACLAGVQAVPSSDIVVFLDGDYSDYPEEMPFLVNPIIEGKADLVIGSRLSGNRGKRALPAHSIFGNWLAAKVLFFLYGLDLTDLGPFRAIRKDVLDDLKLENQTYGFPVEMITKAARKKYRILEIPVSYRKRIGKSKITGTLKGSILAAYHIIFTIFTLRLDQRGELRTKRKH